MNKILFLVLLMCAHVVQAQNASPKPGSQGRVIEEVLVSANKTEQSVQDIAGSVQALSGEMLTKANLTDFGEAMQYLPNAQLVDNGIEPTIAVRGVQSVAAIGGGDNSVGLVIDDLALSRQVYFHNGFFDLERIEVLRGPQGTLFGKSTTAGVVNLISNAPTDEFSGNITLRQGEEDQQVSAAISGPLTDSISARIAVFADRPGATLTNTFTGEDVGFIDRSAVRLKMRWEPTDATELTVFWSGADVDHKNVTVQFENAPEGTREFLRGYDPQFETDPYDGNISFDFGLQTWIDNGQLFGMRLDTDWGAPLLFESLSSTVVLGGSDMVVYAHGDLDSSAADIVRIPEAFENIRMTQLEARVQGTAPGFFGLGGGNSEFISGLFVQKERVHYDYRITFGEDTEAWLAGPGGEALGAPNLGGICVGCITPPGSGGAFAGDGVKILPSMDTIAQGLFTQFTYRPIDPLAITLGLRYDDNERDAHMEVFRLSPTGDGDLSVFGPLLGAEEDVTLTPEIRERELSTKLSLQYEFFEGDVVTYFTWAKGYKGGAFNFFALAPDDVLQVEPEFVETFEVGVKTVLYDRSLVMNLSVYDSTFDDLHVYLTVDDALLPFVELANAAEAISRGVEFDAMFVPGFAPWLTLSGAVAYGDATYTEYKNGPDGSDFTGKTLASAPNWTGVLTPEFTFPLPLLENGVISWAIDALYTSAYWTDTNLSPTTKIPESLIFNSRLSIAPASEAWSLTLAVTNVADKKHLVAREGSGGIWPGAQTARPAPRRHASLDFNWYW